MNLEDRGPYYLLVRLDIDEFGRIPRNKVVPAVETTGYTTIDVHVSGLLYDLFKWDSRHVVGSLTDSLTCSLVAMQLLCELPGKYIDQRLAKRSQRIIGGEVRRRRRSYIQRTKKRFESVTLLPKDAGVRRGNREPTKKLGREEAGSISAHVARCALRVARDRGSYPLAWGY